MVLAPAETQLSQLELPLPRETKLIEIDREQSVQVLPDTKGGTEPYSAWSNRLTIGTAYRGPLLPERGTRSREKALYEYYWNDYNTAYRAAIAGLTKRVQSTPWELTGPDDYVEYFQFILHQGDFGRGWESFIGKLILDYSRFDAGAYIELIGMGDPLDALRGPVTGLAVLDSRRCYPTGDPAYPVLYYDIYGRTHVMHHTRVVRFVDMLDPSEYAYGYGECALSRCISPVVRDILMNRYIEQRLDDNPPSGIMTLQNISLDHFQAARQKLKQDKLTDHGGFGDVILLSGLQVDKPIAVESIPFQHVPEKFDFQTYKQITMKELALGIGIDIQDIWELTGQGLGTATQSEILHQKSKGKALGRILKGLERTINLTLPPSVEFEWQYRDPDEDMQIAQRDQIVIQNILATKASGDITQDEARQLLANNVEMIREAITDQTGEIIRLDDQDVVTDAQREPMQAPERAAGEPTEETTGDATRGETETKDYHQTVSGFQRSFATLVERASTQPTAQFSLEMAMRGQLQQAGEQIWIDGLTKAGVENPRITREAAAAIAGWRAQQNGFITQFAKRVIERGYTPDQAATKAQMWVNKSLNNLYHMALGSGAPAKRWMWVVNPLKEHCFPEGTLIATDNGWCAIEDVAPTEMVYTNEGFKPVTKSYKHMYEGELIQVKKGTANVTCTPNHPFLTQRGWIPAGELTTSDNVVLAQDSEDNAFAHIAFPNTLNIITASAKIFILRVVAFLLRQLPLGKGVKSRVTVPVIPVGLDDKLAYTTIHNEFGFNNWEWDIGDGQFVNGIQDSEQLTFQVRGCAHLPTALPLKQFEISRFPFFGMISPILLNFRDSFRIMHRVMDSQVFRRRPMYQVSENSGIECQSQDPGAVENLLVLQPHDASGFRSPVRGIQLPQFDIKRISPQSTLIHAFVAMVTFAITYILASGTTSIFLVAFGGIILWLLWAIMFLLTRIVCIAATDTTEPLTRRDWLLTLFANLPHSNALSINRKPTHSIPVYNLEVQGNHQYVAQGFLVHNCNTCIRMNGQVHTMKEYLDSGVVPQSEALECGGYRCGCKLVDAGELKPIGRIPRSGRGGLGALFGRIARLFSGLFGG